MKSLKLIGLLWGLLLLGLVSAAPVAATHVDPIAINSGNPNCDDLAELYGPPDADWSEFKLQGGNLANGTYSNGTLTVTISNFVPSNSGTPGSFDWESNIGVDAVFVKAGSDKHNLYLYDPEETEDTGLQTQAGTGNGISHISFCYDTGGEPQGDPLVIGKTVDADFDKTWTWTIDKVVVGDAIKEATPPGTVTFDYKVTVQHGAAVESDFEVTGEITVTNSNDYAVSGVTVTDVLNAGTGCVVTDGTNATIPANDSVNFAYVCTVSDKSATQNTATVDWPDSGGGNLPAGTAFVVEPVAFTLDDEIDECIDVEDDLFGPLSPATVCVGDANPTEYLYSLEFDIPETGCVEHVNTASFETNDTNTPGSDTATVTVCSTFEGCTPGYWKASQHHDSWTQPYDPGDLLGPIFTGESATLSNKTLLQALSFKGGSNIVGAQEILLRAGVAALLNSVSPDVDYKYTEAEVIAAVNAALASGNRATIIAAAADLDMHNNAGCDLN